MLLTKGCVIFVTEDQLFKDIFCVYIYICILLVGRRGGFPGSTDSKESVCNVGDLGLICGLGRFPWRRKWLSTPVFLSGQFSRQRSLAGYSPWARKESDTTE